MKRVLRLGFAVSLSVAVTTAGCGPGTTETTESEADDNAPGPVNPALVQELDAEQEIKAFAGNDAVKVARLSELASKLDRAFAEEKYWQIVRQTTTYWAELKSRNVKQDVEPFWSAVLTFVEKHPDIDLSFSNYVAAYYLERSMNRPHEAAVKVMQEEVLKEAKKHRPER